MDFAGVKTGAAEGGNLLYRVGHGPNSDPETSGVS